MREKAENQSYAISVVNNYFEHIAYDYPNAAVIFLGISDGSEIMHNTICGCGYSGIFGGWGWKNVPYELGSVDQHLIGNTLLFSIACSVGKAIKNSTCNTRRTSFVKSKGAQFPPAKSCSPCSVRTHLG
ncbi:MAG: hypothetical protein IJW49_11740 [Clostridia bacterium]|nr:hypothetical protein [Clostridia bacterium]MBQ9807160.1 hypothetical protein [Clostridia bacterium]